METKTEEFEEEKEQIKILLKEKNIELKDLSIKREKFRKIYHKCIYKCM